MYLRRDRAMTAVTVMLDIAFHTGRSDLVSGVELAERTGLARRGIEPVLQTLSAVACWKACVAPRAAIAWGGRGAIFHLMTSHRLSCLMSRHRWMKHPTPFSGGDRAMLADT
ncbi:hypothetical protein DOFOFD_11910 [Acetobacteraceae bacterium EV16P]|uniref:Uncharacterized protein n=1 Tax=Sorlinia euscelidii TaxID=3081148 RepID=A0ABU7U4B7_9PROT